MSSRGPGRDAPDLRGPTRRGLLRAAAGAVVSAATWGALAPTPAAAKPRPKPKGAPKPPATPKGDEPATLASFLRARTDLGASRGRWEAEVKKRFGGAALKEESEENQEITVARSILAAAMFMGVDPKKGAEAAFEGYRGALGYVPPPVAVQYQILVLQGRKPRGRPIDLAFDFPKFYNDEIAPDLVAYWERMIAEGRIPDDALQETKDALRETQVKMRPLLLDKLRMLARLERDLPVARGGRRAELETDVRGIQGELERAFQGVARRTEVLDARRRAFDRLRIQLEDMGLEQTDEDRLLDPDQGPPPKLEPVTPGAEPAIAEPSPPPTGVPIPQPSPSPKGKGKGRRLVPDGPLTEPEEAPRAPPPPQARPGDPEPELTPMTPRELRDLGDRYRSHLIAVISPWLGTPYVWGGDAAATGTDCSGFARGVMRDGFSLELPRTSRDQFRAGRSVPREELQPGDLVFFDTMNAGAVTHVGVYSGQGQFAHASTSRGVLYAELDQPTMKRTYRGARRVLAYPPSSRP